MALGECTDRVLLRPTSDRPELAEGLREHSGARKSVAGKELSCRCDNLFAVFGLATQLRSDGSRTELADLLAEGVAECFRRTDELGELDAPARSERCLPEKVVVREGVSRFDS